MTFLGGYGGKERPFQLRKLFHKTSDTPRKSHNLNLSFGSSHRKHSLRTTIPYQIPTLLDFLVSFNHHLIKLANHSHKVWKNNNEDHHIFCSSVSERQIKQEDKERGSGDYLVSFIRGANVNRL